VRAKPGNRIRNSNVTSIFEISQKSAGIGYVAWVLQLCSTIATAATPVPRKSINGRSIKIPARDLSGGGPLQEMPGRAQGASG
jgi:hypothetical protein